MKEFACDICRKTVESENNLYTIAGWLETKDIKHLCYSCNTKVSDMLNRIEKITTTVKRTWLQKVMAKLRRQHD